MSKIALIAAHHDPVAQWRRATGLIEDMAPWITGPEEAHVHAPFSSVLCLAGWDQLRINRRIYEVCMSLVEARPGQQRTVPVEGPAVRAAQRAAAESNHEDRERAREEAIPAEPPLNPYAQRLIEAGINPTLVTMLDDDQLRQMDDARVNYTSPPGLWQRYVERTAARFHVTPWATSATDTDVGFLPDAPTPEIQTAELALRALEQEQRRREQEQRASVVRDDLEGFMRMLRAQDSERRAARSTSSTIRDLRRSLGIRRDEDE